MIKIFTTFFPGMTVTEIKELIKLGLFGIRFIYKEIGQEGFFQKLENVEKSLAKIGLPLMLVIDLPGTKPRISGLDGPIKLTKGKKTNLSNNKNGDNAIYINNLTNEQFDRIQVGHLITIADDSITLKVLKKSHTYIQCQNLGSNGTIRNGRSVRFPNSDIDYSALSKKDKTLLDNYMSKQYTYSLAVSFCHDHQVVEELVNHYKIPRSRIIPKIEKVISSHQIRKIITGCRYAILGRGDLSQANESKAWFDFQNKFIRICNKAGVIAIVGTGIFQSLGESDRPRISDVSDFGYLLSRGVRSFLLADDVHSSNAKTAVSTMYSMIDIQKK